MKIENLTIKPMITHFTENYLFEASGFINEDYISTNFLEKPTIKEAEEVLLKKYQDYKQKEIF